MFFSIIAVLKSKVTFRQFRHQNNFLIHTIKEFFQQRRKRAQENHYFNQQELNFQPNQHSV